MSLLVLLPLSMASIHTPAHVSTSALISSLYSPFLHSFSSIKPKTLTLHRVRCDLANQNWLSSSRRLVSFSLFLSPLFLAPNYAMAGSFLDKYVKRKKLDPLEAYVPAVILTQLQIKDLEKTLEVEEPRFASCRSLLRSGPAASLRVNIRAVAQYALDDGTGNTAFNDVDQCLRALEELDSLLLHASRKEPDASVKLMKVKIGIAVDALDSLLHSVPADVLDKGKAIADAYRSSSSSSEEPQVLDPELKQLESIL